MQDTHATDLSSKVKSNTTTPTVGRDAYISTDLGCRSSGDYSKRSLPNPTYPVQIHIKDKVITHYTQRLFVRQDTQSRPCHQNEDGGEGAHEGTAVAPEAKNLRGNVKGTAVFFVTSRKDNTFISPPPHTHKTIMRPPATYRNGWRRSSAYGKRGGGPP